MSNHQNTIYHGGAILYTDGVSRVDYEHCKSENSQIVHFVKATNTYEKDVHYSSAPVNCINLSIFADAMRDLLASGREKFHKIMTVRSANWGKILLLTTRKIIFGAFTNPANPKYAWVDTDQTGVMVLEYFRCSSELILWKDWLLPLEGGYVKLPSPKIQFVMDVWIFSKFSKVWGYLK